MRRATPIFLMTRASSTGLPFNGLASSPTSPSIAHFSASGGAKMGRPLREGLVACTSQTSIFATPSLTLVIQLLGHMVFLIALIGTRVLLLASSAGPRGLGRMSTLPLHLSISTKRLCTVSSTHTSPNGDAAFLCEATRPLSVVNADNSSAPHCGYWSRVSLRSLFLGCKGKFSQGVV